MSYSQKQILSLCTACTYLDCLVSVKGFQRLIGVLKEISEYFMN
jgi:hypothetical protein